MELIQILGNLGADAEVVNHNGAEFVTFRVAVTKKIKKQGETVPVTTWYSCSWNSTSSSVISYMKKGEKVLVIGRPEYIIFDSMKYKCKMIDVRIYVDRVFLAGSSSDKATSQSTETAQQNSESDKSSESENVPIY